MTLRLQPRPAMPRQHLWPRSQRAAALTAAARQLNTAGLVTTSLSQQCSQSGPCHMSQPLIQLASCFCTSLQLLQVSSQDNNQSGNHHPTCSIARHADHALPMLPCCRPADLCSRKQWRLHRQQRPFPAVLPGRLWPAQPDLCGRHRQSGPPRPLQQLRAPDGGPVCAGQQHHQPHTQQHICLQERHVHGHPSRRRCVLTTPRIVA